MNPCRVLRILTLVVTVLTLMPASLFAQNEENGPPGDPIEDLISGRLEFELLPGLEGFELPEYMQSLRWQKFSSALELAAERVDTGWARGMQNRILSEIPNASDAPLNRIEVACRTTWCGIVIEIPEDVDRGIRSEIADHLENTIGLPITGLPIARSFTYGIGRSERPDIVTIFLKFDR